MVPYRPFYLDFTEWKRERDRSGNLPDRRDARDTDIEQLFDAAIRHRFGVFISRAKLELMDPAGQRTGCRSRKR